MKGARSPEITAETGVTVDVRVLLAFDAAVDDGDDVASDDSEIEEMATRAAERRITKK